MAQGEHWTKVIGPFLLYINAGKAPAEMYADAVAEGPFRASGGPTPG